MTTTWNWSEIAAAVVLGWIGVLALFAVLAWVIDQVVRILTGSKWDPSIESYKAGEAYVEWVTASKAGVDGPETYGWDEGIAP